MATVVVRVWLIKQVVYYSVESCCIKEVRQKGNRTGSTNRADLVKKTTGLDEPLIEDCCILEQSKIVWTKVLPNCRFFFATNKEADPIGRINRRQKKIAKTGDRTVQSARRFSPFRVSPTGPSRGASLINRSPGSKMGGRRDTVFFFLGEGVVGSREMKAQQKKRVKRS